MLRTRAFALRRDARLCYQTRMRAFWSFARAPLAWSLALLALYAPFAFIRPVTRPPPPGCDDWLWCSDAYVGLVFERTPHPEDLVALLIVPSAFVAFLAARIAAGAPNRHAHWFMAGPVLAMISGPIILVFYPVHLFFADVSRSYVPALIGLTIQAGFWLAMWAAFPLAVVTLLGAVAWRLRPRPLAAVG
jgi:hypothetical protein